LQVSLTPLFSSTSIYKSWGRCNKFFLWNFSILVHFSLTSCFSQVGIIPLLDNCSSPIAGLCLHSSTAIPSSKWSRVTCLKFKFKSARLWMKLVAVFLFLLPWRSNTLLWHSQPFTIYFIVYQELRKMPGM
jgi:hypothetical protein